MKNKLSFQLNFQMAPTRRQVRRAFSGQIFPPRSCFLFLAILATICFAENHAFSQNNCSDATACANAVFCSGFEEGNKTIWDDYDGNPDDSNLLLSSDGPCGQLGNHVMRLRVPPGNLRQVP